MINTYEVIVQFIEEVHTLPGIWPADDLRQLLSEAEFEDAESIAEPDLLEMALMALQDLGIQLAGELVLEVVFGEAMRRGVRQNLVDDLQEDRPWDDFANVSQQRGLFEAVVLLHQAFPTRFGTPDAQRMRFSVRALAESGLPSLAKASPEWLIRLLACGLSETDVLQRLYEDELASDPFSDAAGLIWHLETIDSGTAQGDDQADRTFELIASPLWFGPLAKGQTFPARA